MLSYIYHVGLEHSCNCRDVAQFVVFSRKMTPPTVDAAGCAWRQIVSKVITKIDRHIDTQIPSSTLALSLSIPLSISLSLFVLRNSPEPSRGTLKIVAQAVATLVLQVADSNRQLAVN